MAFVVSKAGGTVVADGVDTLTFVHVNKFNGCIALGCVLCRL